MSRSIAVSLCVAVVAAGSALSSGTDAADSPSCTSPEYRQFDFWLGDWQVAGPTGKPVGRNRITAIHNGCALQEQWTGNGGSTGTSLNTYDASRKRWHQTWVDNGGNLLLLEGSFADGRMTLSGATQRAEATGTDLQRITWTPQPDGRVRQLWEASEDDGKSWKVVFDGWYSKAR
ncbi:MAG TPA: hypothetical protein VMV45_09455 [Casimicrobiaceae bacterium]|nr:hypothetical protein [Casimicrobiaceae bacterium]